MYVCIYIYIYIYVCVYSLGEVRRSVRPLDLQAAPEQVGADDPGPEHRHRLGHVVMEL